MQKSELEPGQIMQLDPEKTRNQAFRAQLLVVTEPKSFGAQGYIMWDHPMPDDVMRLAETGRAYYRATWEEMEPTGGTIVWEREDEAD
jgi:hypothetical protein